MHNSVPINEARIIAQIKQLASDRGWAVLLKRGDQHAGLAYRQRWPQGSIDKDMVDRSSCHDGTRNR